MSATRARRSTTRSRYTKDRKQFGRSLSSFQVLKHRMAENECEVEAARLLVYNAATKMARGERAIKEVSMAKVFAADVAVQDVAFNGMQALRRLRAAARVRHGALLPRGQARDGRAAARSEIQRSIIAKEMGL